MIVYCLDFKRKLYSANNSKITNIVYKVCQKLHFISINHSGTLLRTVVQYHIIVRYNHLRNAMITGFILSNHWRYLIDVTLDFTNYR